MRKLRKPFWEVADGDSEVIDFDFVACVRARVRGEADASSRGSRQKARRVMEVSGLRMRR